jgi:Lipopolysaccharide-assembly
MRTQRQRSGIAFCLLLAGLACLSGCESGGHFTLLGYTTKPPFDCDIRNVYVPIALNTTYLRGVEYDLTRAVVRELGTSPYKVTSDRTRADTELVMKVVLNGKSVILMNQLGENRDAEVRINIEVVWRDLRPGHTGDILSNPKRFDAKEVPLPGDAPAKAPMAVPLLVTPSASYIPELGGSNTSAQAQMVNRAAKQIVNMMEVWR